jgi:methyl-accepting chemotaxis protein
MHNSREESGVPRTEAEVRASLDAVIEDVEKNQRIYGWFSKNIGDMARASRDMVDVFERRFEQVDQRFEQVDQRFEQVDQRFEQVDQRLEQIDRRFDNVDTEIGLLQDSVRTMDARIEKLVAYIIRDEVGEAAGKGQRGKE